MTDELGEKRALAGAAKEIIESKAFDIVKAKLRGRFILALMSATTNEQKLDIVAKLNMIEEVVNELHGLHGDYRRALKGAADG
jgi:hypothetical protein